MVFFLDVVTTQSPINIVTKDCLRQAHPIHLCLCTHFEQQNTTVKIENNGYTGKEFYTKYFRLLVKYPLVSLVFLSSRPSWYQSTAYVRIPSLLEVEGSNPGADHNIHFHGKNPLVSVKYEIYLGICDDFEGAIFIFIKRRKWLKKTNN